MKSGTITYNQAADYFIGLANETGSLITNLKLQKLVYYAQAWHLALSEVPLFEEKFEAWVHGPVIRELYNTYKHHQWHPIDKRVDLNELKADLSSTPAALSTLEDVADVYFELDAYKLERLTHSEEPWLEARGSLADNEPCSNTIDIQTMQRYYANLIPA